MRTCSSALHAEGGGSAERGVRGVNGGGVHTSSMLHGVSRMWRGVRYSLILFFPGGIGRARNYTFLAGACSTRAYF